VCSDGELSNEDLCMELADAIAEAGPWGQAFSEPLFDGVFSVIDQRLVGVRHLKLTLQVGENKTNKMFDAIAFNIDTHLWPNHRCQRIHAAYRLDINEFRSVRSVQLIIEHLQEV
jgi:single-stranded-DNA-specific exonuclease